MDSPALGLARPEGLTRRGTGNKEGEFFTRRIVPCLAGFLCRHVGDAAVVCLTASGEERVWVVAEEAKRGERGRNADRWGQAAGGEQQDIEEGKEAAFLTAGELVRAWAKAWDRPAETGAEGASVARDWGRGCAVEEPDGGTDPTTRHEEHGDPVMAEVGNGRGEALAGVKGRGNGVADVVVASAGETVFVPPQQS